ncbi:XRE family transcriptional regulator [Glaciimonas sp. CA11.2]|uniref:helix-turn-helix domain-containing protein n=1 Tax=unclassified Glaciimonas TaxID=2644401 RepID=UPI002AB48FA7|nr:MULTISPECIES: XRE family transcriptional regulator [unclassified Glaciimonas]MDY7546136.1 XRE family transcriptional regulator [Glaciimonas sp. CA11.2]MEB0010909.1 XRE family transcriptional regulator [Glaciimonas sp. Cout2]MEB0081691.1 XRE family transcriptional regulator [Glaciimonas sp. Gout2]MEB0161832.1 XRE family transcriptional regulator [Glaciimonas sp. CA11.2]
MIADRIRRARILRGLSLDGLAQKLGDVTKQGLSKYEQGKVTPNSTRLIQLAKALEVKPEYFFRKDSVSLAPLEFRKLAKMPRYRQEQVEEQIREHLERYIELEKCFDAADNSVPVMAPRSISVISVEDAENAASTLRDQWKIGGDAIANLTELLEEHGIKVALLSGCDDFDGACAATKDEEHVLVALNASRPGERMRFTAAHELGHWVMALPASMPEKIKELCCHRFAGAFLYPAERVKTDFGHHQRSRVHPRELLNAKQLYGVSMQVVLRRLKDLSLLSEPGYKSINIQFSVNGWRKNEPGVFLSERPRRFESLVFWGLAEDIFTLSRAAEFLQQPVGTFDTSLSDPLGRE